MTVVIEAIPFLMWSFSDPDMSTCECCKETIFSKNCHLGIDLLVNGVTAKEAHTDIVICRSCYDLIQEGD